MATTIDIPTLCDAVEAGDAFVLDVRTSAKGAQIYGAIRYDPKKLIEAPTLRLPLPKDGTRVVLYDEDGTGERLGELAAKLLENGYEGIVVLDGGWHAYAAAGGKTEEPTLEQPVPEVSTHQPER